MIDMCIQEVCRYTCSMFVVLVQHECRSIGDGSHLIREPSKRLNNMTFNS